MMLENWMDAAVNHVGWDVLLLVILMITGGVVAWWRWGERIALGAAWGFLIGVACFGLPFVLYTFSQAFLELQFP